MILIARFLIGIDMARNSVLQFFFIYALAIIILSVIMIIKDRKYRRNNAIYKNMNFFYYGIITIIVCILFDVVMYMCGIRSVPGHATFSRVGSYVFFLKHGDRGDNGLGPGIFYIAYIRL